MIKNSFLKKFSKKARPSTKLYLFNKIDVVVEIDIEIAHFHKLHIFLASKYEKSHVDLCKLDFTDTKK